MKTTLSNTAPFGLKSNGVLPFKSIKAWTTAAVSSARERDLLEVPAYQTALSVLKQCASAHHSNHKESALSAKSIGAVCAVLSAATATESCDKSGVPVESNGAVTKRPKSKPAQTKRVVLPFDVVILPLAVFLCCVLEFLHATAQAAHEFRNFTASKKQQYNEDNQNDLCRSNGSHPVDFGAKFGENNSSQDKEKAKVRQMPVSPHKITGHIRQATLSISRTPPNLAATKTRIFPGTHVGSNESPFTTLKYSTVNPKDSNSAAAIGHAAIGSVLSATCTKT